MTARLRTLAALAASWPAWMAAGWLAARLSPGGAELLLQAALMLAWVGLTGRLLDRDEETDPHA